MTTYVTVAIPYVNASPHLGYAFELVQADVFARARRLAGDRVRFLGGTDDHSLKNVVAAEVAGVPTADFVDANASRFEALQGPLQLSFDDFIRTSSDPRHAPAVGRLWQACAAAGDLYQRRYSGDYCFGCEQFYGDGELVGGRCPEHGAAVERVAEENWFFRLSAYQGHIEGLITSGELAVCPEPFRDEVLAFVRAGLEDISVSRSAERARGWGLGVPGDGTQVISVWFDALTNYISALGFGDEGSADYRAWWLEADRRVHVVGKGILRFHAVCWPAFLASAGQPPPTRIQVHPYLTAAGEKLSKSTGGAPAPEVVVADFGVDALRWWFTSDVTTAADTDFTTDRLVARANEDLANGLGNLTNRVVTLVHRCRGGVVPGAGPGPISAVRDLDVRALDAISAFDLRGAAQLIRSGVGALNRELETTRPWDLARHETDGDEALDVLLARYVHSLQALARAAEPIIPTLSAHIQRQLAGPGKLPEPKPTFERLQAP